MNKLCRVAFLTVLSLLCLASLSGITQSIALTEEQIYLYVFPYGGQPVTADPYGGEIYLIFVFSGVDGPLDASDFTNEPSFEGMTIGCSYSLDNSTDATTIYVSLDTSVDGVSVGRMKADIMKEKVENHFEIASLPYTEESTTNDVTSYTYEINECPDTQKFRDALLQLKPSTGFGQIITPALIGNNVTIYFILGMDEGLPEWTIEALIHYPNYFPYSTDREYTVSLKTLAGYSGTIQSSPEASASTLEIYISQTKEYQLLSIEATPSQMQMQQHGTAPWLYWTSSRTITGSSVDDLAIHFRLVSPGYMDPITILMLIGAAAAAIAVVVIVIFVIWRRRASRYRF